MSLDEVIIKIQTPNPHSVRIVRVKTDHCTYNVLIFIIRTVQSFGWSAMLLALIVDDDEE